MKVLLFGGTTEGRLIAEAVAGSSEGGRISTMHVCVATDYGACLLPEDDRITIHHERMDMGEILDIIKQEGFDACIDATHPYADLVSSNIREACREAGLKLYRVGRPGEADDGKHTEYGPVRVASAGEAADYLKDTEGNIFIATGTKDLKDFTLIPDHALRCYVRVLPSVEAVKECRDLGFSPSHIICMQGPFTKDLNVSMFRACDATYLVTKESGSKGGFMEKMDAAYEAGVKPVIIGRPAESSEEVYSLEQVFEIFGLAGSNDKKAYLIGMGCADTQLTRQAIDALIDSDHIIGADRMIKDLKKLDGVRTADRDGRTLKLSDKKLFISYDKDEQEKYIKDKNPSRVALLYSGDIGFYSGASGIVDRLDGYEIVTIPGISSGIYLCDRLMVPWQNIRFLSCHGRDVNIKDEIGHHRRLLILLGGEDDAAGICRELCLLGEGKARVHIGEELGYKHENIITARAEELTGLKTSSLAVMLIIAE